MALGDEEHIDTDKYDTNMLDPNSTESENTHSVGTEGKTFAKEARMCPTARSKSSVFSSWDIDIITSLFDSMPTVI